MNASPEQACVHSILVRQHLGFGWFASHKKLHVGTQYQNKRGLHERLCTHSTHRQNIVPGNEITSKESLQTRSHSMTALLQAATPYLSVTCNTRSDCRSLNTRSTDLHRRRIRRFIIIMCNNLPNKVPKVEFTAC